jgi:Xaa-Pro aminopeptidase
VVGAADIDIYRWALPVWLPARLEAGGVGRLGIEAWTMTVGERDDLAGKLSGIELVGTSKVVERLRRIKSSSEVAAIRRAVALGDATFEWVLDRIAPGRTEREIALDIEFRIRSSGADDVSFDPIVGSGPLSAHIHHTPGDRRLQRGDLVLMDFGSLSGGYRSDLTRTVVLGRGTPDQRDTYATVLRAQAIGIEAIRAGERGSDVDAAARAHIDAAGFAEEFGHGLGHGVGLDIHEAPRLARTSEDSLVAGDVVTVEPGIYRPERGGIRIEDCVLVTDEGAEVLGAAPKDELIEVT